MDRETFQRELEKSLTERKGWEPRVEHRMLIHRKTGIRILLANPAALEKASNLLGTAKFTAQVLTPAPIAEPSWYRVPNAELTKVPDALARECYDYLIAERNKEQERIAREASEQFIKDLVPECFN